VRIAIGFGDIVWVPAFYLGVGLASTRGGGEKIRRTAIVLKSYRMKWSQRRDDDRGSKTVRRRSMQPNSRLICFTGKT